MPAQNATVTVLTAEVRTLQVGARQVTMSVYRQLDWIDPWLIEPFGRVCGDDDWYSLEMVGRNPADGCLVRAGLMGGVAGYGMPGHYPGTPEEWVQLVGRLRQLPLIVLAGLR